MKGQSFLIMAIIFIIILALIKLTIKFYQFQDDRSLILEFENVKEEVIKSVEYSIYEKENITKNLESFVEFARNSLKRKALDFESLLVEITVPDVLENNELNISIKNLLGCEIVFLNITFSYDNSTKEFTRIIDGEKINTSFTFFTNQNKNYSLIVFYKTPYTQSLEEINIEVEVGKNKFIGFFDIRLESKNARLRDKILKVYELPD